MKIERVTPILVGRSLLVRVYTDEGLIGTGEAGLWAQHRIVAETIKDLEEYFVGKDVGSMEHHFQSVTRDAHFSSPILSAALSAIDVALWDILGKAVGKPVHQLLGGMCRDKVRVFLNISGASVEQHVSNAREAVDAGYTSIRSMPFLPDWEKQDPSSYLSTAVEIVGKIREEIGPKIDLGVEIHRNFSPDEAVTMAHAIEPYMIQYYEDPVAPESLVALQYVADHVNIPIAAGERCHSLFQFKELLDTRTAALIRPDLSLAGGFTQCKKIAAVAEASFVSIFPHLMGSPVNTAAYVQFAASIPNYAIMESGFTELNDIVENPPKVVGGYIEVSKAPGIGIEIREEALSKFPYRRHSISPSIRADGSVAH